jgi:hypothetical protein
MLDRVRRKTPDLDTLRKLNLKIRKQGSSVYDALRGSSMLDKLNQLGTSPGKLDDLIRILSELAAERQIGKEELLNASIELRKLESETDKSYKEVIMDFTEKEASIKRLEQATEKTLEKIRKLRSKKRDLGISINDMKRELTSLCNTKKDLRGLNLDELGKLAAHARKEILLDDRILERQNALESLKRKIGFLRKCVADIRRIDRILEMRNVNLMCPNCGGLSWRTLSKWECENLLWNRTPLPVVCVHCGNTTYYDITRLLITLSLEVLT